MPGTPPDNIFTIVDLPKGFRDWQYGPPRPTTFRVIRKGENKVQEILVTLQEPLLLYVGDIVLFAVEAVIPPAFMELTRGNSGHPSYATLKNEYVVPAKPKTAPKKAASPKPAADQPLYVG